MLSEFEIQNKIVETAENEENLISSKKACSLINKNIDGAIIVSNKKNIEITRIFPKNLISGIGCKRDTKEENILNAIYDILDKHNLSINSIKHFATVNLKADELGLVLAIKKREKMLKSSKEEELERLKLKQELKEDFISLKQEFNFCETIRIKKSKILMILGFMLLFCIISSALISYYFLILFGIVACLVLIF